MGSSANKLHLVCIPYPAQGHIKPMFQLAKLLHSKGFHITFVYTEYNLRRLLGARGPNSADGLEHFRFEAIPDGLPSSDADATQDIPVLCQTIMSNNLLEPFKNLLHRLNDPSSSSPPVTCVISDSAMPFTIDASREVNVPLVWLWTASVCGFMGYSQFRPLINKGIVPFQESTFLTDGMLDKIVDWAPNSLKDIQLKYIPSFIRTTNRDDVMLNFLMLAAETTAISSAPVIFNSFHAFEHHALSDSSQVIAGPSYTIGPLDLLVDAIPEHPAPAATSLGSNLWKENTHCLKWLDSKPPNSVVYVSFGSITTMTNDNLVEFAWGLANSNHFFLWVLRPDLDSGKESVVTNEFISETKDRGMIISWCDQAVVLQHPSVGGFLTHCGWNSTLDTVCGGVPVLCWPFFAEQQTNCWFSCGKWGIGMEIDGSVDRKEVEKQVRELIEGEKGEEMRRNAMEWKRLAVEAVEKGKGSSYLNFEKLITDVLLPMRHD